MMGKDRGFTIIELLISMTIFSLVMVLISVSIIQISRVYYKGITSSRTQETARSVLQDISQAIQFNGGQIASSGNVYCVGDRRYTVFLNQQVQDSPAHNGIIADKPSGGCRLPPIAPAHSDAVLVADDTELLVPRARVGKFSISQQGTSNLYQVTVRVVSGDDDLLVDADGTPGPDLPYTCKAQQSGGQFCAVSELSTIVQQRVQ